MKEMTAKEAREKATSISNEKLSNEWDEVMADINEHAEKAKFSFNFYGTLLEQTIRRLQNSGYTVHTQAMDQRDEGDNYVYIEW